MMMHSQCNAESLIDPNIIFERVNILVKLIEYIQYYSRLFKIDEHYQNNYQKDVEELSKYVNSFVDKVENEIK